MDSDLTSQPNSYFVASYHIFFLADKSWFRFLRYSDWEIPIMDAILDVRTEDGKHQRIRVRIPDNMTAPPPQEKTRYFVITQNMMAIMK